MTKESLVDKQFSSNRKIKKKNEEGKQYRPEVNKGLSLERKRKGDRYRTMSYETTQKIIHRFLTCDRINSDGKREEKYTKEELAKKLGITLLEFRKLESLNGYDSVKEKITLPLVSLYCSISCYAEFTRKMKVVQSSLRGQ